MISVIIPCFNEEERIGNTLENLLLQEEVDFEVIVVDNNSKDNTGTIAKGFPIKVLREERQGIMWACEYGRSIAQGNIIVRMDADCLPPKDWLKRGSDYFNDPKVSGVSGPYDYYDARPFFRSITLLIQKYVYSVSNAWVQKFTTGGVMIGGNSFMRASSLHAIGGFNTGIVFYGDDTDTAKRLSKYGRIVFDKRLIIPSSARRFKNEGILKIAWNYLKGFVTVIINSDKDGSKVNKIEYTLHKKTVSKNSSTPSIHN